MSLSTSTLIFVRHGETDVNVAGRIDDDGPGQPLNARGRQQAEAVAQYLADQVRTGQAQVQAIYVSDQLRACQTAEAIGRRLNLSVRTHIGLREIKIGTTPDMSAEEMMRVWHQYAERSRADPDYALPGGESPRQLTERIARTLREIIHELAGQHAVIVSHQGALSTGISYLLNDLANWRTYQMANCGVTRVLMGTLPRLQSMNEAEHLTLIGTAVWKPEPVHATAE
jgi:probable phosphoglycerate mutase